MDNSLFDRLVKHLYLVRSRREGLRALIAGFTAGALGPALPAAATHCRSSGDRCDIDEQCCSGECSPRKVKAAGKGKKGKNQKKTKGKRKTTRREVKKEKSRCECSVVQDACNDSRDCCFKDLTCDSNGCREHAVCCLGPAAPCFDDCDCCGDLICGDETRLCEEEPCDPLKETQEICRTIDDCCFEDDVCESIDPACPGREGAMQCCVPAGKECEEHCDCCVPNTCVSGVCVKPGDCTAQGEICTSPAECCDQTPCTTVVCNGGTSVRCCRPLGGDCEDDCDCCGSVMCINGVCGGSA